MTHLRIWMLSLLACSVTQAAQVATLKNGFTLEASIQQSQGEAGFEIGEEGEPIISKLTYDLDGTLISFTGSGPLAIVPGMSYRLNYATSVSIEGESVDLDWEDGVLTDESVSQTEADASIWSAELLYEFSTTDTARFGGLLGYSSRSFDFETSDTYTSLSFGEEVDFYDEGIVSTWDVEFTSFDIGLYGNWNLSDRLIVQTECAWSPFMEAETEALWILRDYPFEQSAEGMGFSVSAKAAYQITETVSAVLGLKYIELTADEDGLESGIADGIEPYSDEPIVPEISTEMLTVELGIMVAF